MKQLKKDYDDFYAPAEIFAENYFKYKSQHPSERDYDKFEMLRPLQVPFYYPDHSGFANQISN